MYGLALDMIEAKFKLDAAQFWIGNIKPNLALTECRIWTPSGFKFKLEAGCLELVEISSRIELFSGKSMVEISANTHLR